MRKIIIFELHFPFLEVYPQFHDISDEYRRQANSIKIVHFVSQNRQKSSSPSASESPTHISLNTPPNLPSLNPPYPILNSPPQPSHNSPETAPSAHNTPPRTNPH